jgi:hypothetical protein
MKEVTNSSQRTCYDSKSTSIRKIRRKGQLSESRKEKKVGFGGQIETQDWEGVWDSDAEVGMSEPMRNLTVVAGIFVACLKRKRLENVRRVSFLFPT